MIRLIGILTGSAIAISFLIVALGVPELVTRQEADSGSVPMTLAEAPDVPVPAAEPFTVAASPPLQEIQPASEQQSAPVAEPEAAPVAEQVIAAVDASPADAEPALPHSSAIAAEAELQPLYERVPATDEQNWYAFWSPFRSEIAADGFIAQLQRTTGLDYRVVKLKPGVYEVAFAYSDDTDIADKLARISAATGLEMTGS